MHSTSDLRSESLLLSSQPSNSSRESNTTLPRFDDEAGLGRAPSRPHGVDKMPFVVIEPSGIDDIDDLDLIGTKPALWRRVQASVRSMFRHERNKASSSTSWLPVHKLWSGSTFGRRPRLFRLLVNLVIAYLAVVGAIHVLDNFFGAFDAAFPDPLDRFAYSGAPPGDLSEALLHWPTDATGDIHPVNCHSHNDYWRPMPLYNAIYAGCTGVEADVWLVNDKLLVGHRRMTLTSSRTLQNLYLDPLLDLLEKQNPQIEDSEYEDAEVPRESNEAIPLNGVFDVDPDQTLVVLIDFKTSGPRLWAKLNEELRVFRERGYLTHFNGSAVVQRPITVVGTGNAPFDLLTQNETYRDVFFDAPLDALADTSSVWPNPNREQDPTRAIKHKGNEAGNTHAKSSLQAPRNLTRAELQPDTKGPRLLPTEPDEPGHLVASPAIPGPRPQHRDQTHNRDLGQGRSGTTVSTVYDTTNSYYASVSFTASVGHIWGSRLTQSQLQLIRSQVRGAHQRGLKVRYFSLPAWPIGRRNHVWHVLMREGADMFSIDDLRGGRWEDWRRKRSWGS